MPNQEQPDVRLLRGEKLPEAPFPATRAADFRIHFHPAAHGRAVAHAKESTSVEICGVLVGDFGQDTDGPFVRISDIIRCDTATKKFAEVTFTHDSWTQINREMDTRFASLRIVGWYHSHPDFGIFLSDRDVFIQQNFFSGPGQIAFVVDPVRDAEGIFEWHDGKPALSPHYWVGGRITGGEATARGGGQVGGPEAARGSASMSHSVAGSAAMPTSSGESSRLSTLMTMAMCVMFFVLGLLLAGRRSSPWEDARIIEGVSSHFRQWKGHEAEERLFDVRKGIAVVSSEIAKLSEDHVKLSGDNAKDRAKEWAMTRQLLQECGLMVGQLEERYSLSPEDGSIYREEVLRMAKAIVEQAAQKEKEAARAAEKSQEKSKEKSSDKPSAKSGEKSESGKSSPAKSSESEKKHSDEPAKKSSEKSR